MPDRIVVCFGEPNRATLSEAEGMLPRARDLLQRAKAFGATLCTWSWDSLSFSFQVDDLEEAIGFVTGPDARKLVFRFGIGIAQGELDLLYGDGGVELGWGAVLERSQILSRIAKAGEVLVDCDMLTAQHVQLVTRGSRRIEKPYPIRAFSIAVDDPFRADAERTVERLVEPPLVGRDAALERLRVAPGTLATIRAARGFGGSRLLRALAYREKQSRWLLVEPVGQGMEPLGSLRRALSRSRATSAPRQLSDANEDTWSLIAHGRGADPQSAAEVLEAWLADGEDGLLLIDDAHAIDSASLDVIATALLGAAVPFRAIARMDDDSPLPAELAPLPPGPEVELTKLDDEELKALVQGWTGGAMTDEEAAVWAERAGGLPLALGEALAEALSTGELRWSDKGARPRSIPPRAPSPAAASTLIARRLRFLTPGSRTVLFALAMLGGDAAESRVTKLLEVAADIPVDLEIEQDRLAKLGWIRVPEPGFLALPSRTHLRVIGRAVPETRRAAWHRAASTTIEEEANLELSEAAWHAAQADDRARAQRLARRAARMAEAAGLDNASRDLVAFARAHDPAPRPRIESDASGLLPRPPMASSPGDPEEIFPVALAARGPKRPSRFTFPPVEVPEGELLSEPPSVPPVSEDLDDDDLLPISSVEPVLSAEILGPDDIRRSVTDGESKRDLPAPPEAPEVHNPVSVQRPTPPGSVRRPNLELLFDDHEKQEPNTVAAAPPSVPRPTRPYREKSKPFARPAVPRPSPEAVPPPPPSILDQTQDDEPPTVRAPFRDPMGSIHELTADDAIGLMVADSSATVGMGGAAKAMRDAVNAAVSEVFAVPVEEEPSSERTLVSEDPPMSEAPAEPEADDEPSAIRVLRTGTSEQIEAWAARTLEQAPERRRLVERVLALAELREGKRTEAVRKLRVACEQAKSLSSVERARSRLAFALGLARVGRPIEALVEGLEALSRAREAGDVKAERACVAFLRTLYESQGQESNVWHLDS